VSADGFPQGEAPRHRLYDRGQRPGMVPYGLVPSPKPMNFAANAHWSVILDSHPGGLAGSVVGGGLDVQQDTLRHDLLRVRSLAARPSPTSQADALPLFNKSGTSGTACSDARCLLL